MDEIGEIGDGSVHYAESVRHVGGLGIEEIPGLFSEESVSMDHPWIRSAVMEMGADGPKGRAGVSCRPFRARLIRGSTWSSTFGSTPGLKLLSRLRGC